jgi:hypothetical protein
MTEEPDYRVTLRPLRDDVPAIIRLRRWLKRSLRGYGLRCLHVEEIVRPDKTREEKENANHDDIQAF